MTEANQRLRADNTEIAERIDIYAQVIRELATALETLRAQPEPHDNIRRLPVHNQHSQA
jgi:hypothetical protein